MLVLVLKRVPSWKLSPHDCFTKGKQKSKLNSTLSKLRKQRSKLCMMLNKHMQLLNIINNNGKQPKSEDKGSNLR